MGKILNSVGFAFIVFLLSHCFAKELKLENERQSANQFLDKENDLANLSFNNLEVIIQAH